LAGTLITGGAGFIGSHLAERLVARGDTVRVLDSFDPFYDRRVKERNLERVRAAARDATSLEVVEGDIRDPAAVARAGRGVAAVVHLAALAGVRPSIEDPVRYADVNLTGTQVLLSSLQGRPDVRFVFGSSSSVYGGNSRVPFSEDDPVDVPVSPYASTKRGGELLCRTFHHLAGNPVTCLRFFTVYGPAQRPEMAIHMFTRHIASGRPVPFFGDGLSARDYTYVDDIVSGVVAALDRADGFRIYNLGGAATTPLAELVQRISDAVGKPAILDRRPDQIGDMKVTFADVTRARAELGYEVTVPVAVGIPRFVAWYLAERTAGRVA
jgi:UDP-glucuronate 4-epimerase